MSLTAEQYEHQKAECDGLCVIDHDRIAADNPNLMPCVTCPFCKEIVDAILTPVSPTTAFKIGEKTDDPLAMYLSDIFTIPVNLAGLPALSLPAKTDGLPVGFQLIGKPFREADILGIGRFFEESVQGLI